MRIHVYARTCTHAPIPTPVPKPIHTQIRTRTQPPPTPTAAGMAGWMLSEPGSGVHAVSPGPVFEVPDGQGRQSSSLETQYVFTVQLACEKTKRHGQGPTAAEFSSSETEGVSEREIQEKGEGTAWRKKGWSVDTRSLGVLKRW